MIRVNLLPWREAVLQRRKQQWLTRALLMLVVLLTVNSALWLSLTQSGKQTAVWVAQQKKLQALTSRLLAEQQQLSQQLVDRQQQDEARQALADRLDNWRRFWVKLPALMPLSLWLISVAQEQTTLTFRGQADTLSSLMLFTRNLRRQAFFTRVDIQEMQGTGQGDYRFTLRAYLAVSMQLYGGWADD
ncbi:MULTISPECIES: PilN domain-containing protein [unclassified Tatumella]|uniref:PilN domain-containing protein n=1 Tax=unclassified Tatumella TaxID=2649542 RepID=UPI001BB04434|nr:PilN domain-containing protein [Tatumella sp. JGM16]MBS0912474.1 PilN domain-containing protein [Tatumella sp. JGM91]